MNVYNLKQVPSEAQIQKYIRRIVFGKNNSVLYARAAGQFMQLRIDTGAENVK